MNQHDLRSTYIILSMMSGSRPTVSSEKSPGPSRQRGGPKSVSTRSLSDESSTSSWVHVPPSLENPDSSKAPIRSNAPIQRTGDVRPTCSRIIAEPSPYFDFKSWRPSSSLLPTANRPSSSNLVGQNDAGERYSARPVVESPRYPYDTDRYDYYARPPSPAGRNHEEDYLPPIPPQRPGSRQVSRLTRRADSPPVIERPLSDSRYYWNPPLPSYATIDQPSLPFVVYPDAAEEFEGPNPHMAYYNSARAVQMPPRKTTISVNRDLAPTVPQFEEKPVTINDRRDRYSTRHGDERTFGRFKLESPHNSMVDNNSTPDFNPKVRSVRPPPITPLPSRPSWLFFLFTKRGASWSEIPIVEQQMISESEIKRMFQSDSASGHVSSQLRRMGPQRRSQIERHIELLNSMQRDGYLWEPVWTDNVETKLKGLVLEVLVFSIIYRRKNPGEHVHYTNRSHVDYPQRPSPAPRTSDNVMSEPKAENRPKTDKKPEKMKKRKKKESKVQTQDEKVKKPYSRALITGLLDASKSESPKFILPTASQRSINNDIAKKMTQLEHRILAKYELPTLG